MTAPTRRRKTLTIAAAAAVLLVGGAVTTCVVVTQHNAAVTAAEESWNSSAKTYSTSVLTYDENKDARNAAVSSTAGLDPQPLLDAVGAHASAESIAALTGARDAIVAALPEGKDTKSEHIATVKTLKRPADIDGMNADSKALMDEAVDIDIVASSLFEETKTVRDLATAYEDAEIGVTTSLADNASKAATTYPEASAESIAAVATPLASLVQNNEAEIVDVENVKSVSDALNAVKASHDATVAAKAEADAQNGTDNGGSSNTSNGNRSGGTNNNGSTGGTNNNGSTNNGGTNNGNNTPSTPTQPTAPTQPTQPTTPTYTAPTTNVPTVGGGNCAVVGSATSTAGNHLNAPSGVTHHSLSGSGNSWTFTWYTCE